MRSVRFWIALSLLLGVNAAGLVWIRRAVTGGDVPRVRILAVLPDGPADEATRLGIRFDVPLATPERIGGAPERTLFTLDPLPPGRWVWGAADRLDYELDAPLPPGRTFVLRPSADLETTTGRRLTGPTEHAFRTRALSLRDIGLTRSDEDVVDVELSFDQPVSPEACASYVRLSCADTDATCAPELLGTADDKVVRIRTTRPRSDELCVEVRAGLPPRDGDRGLEQGRRAVLRVAPVFALLSVRPSTPSLEARGVVDLDLSADLDDSAFRRVPRVSPAIDDLTVERVSWDRSRLRLRGAFRSGVRYEVSLPAGLRARDGRRLAQPQVERFTFPDREPDVGFTADAGTLSPKGGLALPLEAVNARAIRVRASRVHGNNLVRHLRGLSSRYTSQAVIAETSFPLDLPPNEPRPVSLDLRALLGPDARGIYRIEAATGQSHWFGASATVTIVDLALTVKRERGGLACWVNEVSTAAPVGGARVHVLSATNQPLGEAVTDGDGVAHVAIGAASEEAPFVVVGERGDEVVYQRVDRKAHVVDGLDAGGRAHPGAYDVLLYTERGVYRPGETVHLTGVVRDREGAVPPPFPLEVQVVRPDGREADRLRIEPNEGARGTFEVDVPVADYAPTGAHRFRAMLPGASEPLGEAQVLVEAYVPARIEVHAEPASGGDEGGARLEVAARYLVGAPAAGLRLQTRGSWREVAFESARHPSFVFCTHEKAGRAPFEVEGTLDASGRAVAVVPGPEDLGPGLYRASAHATVTEEGGRSVSAGADLRLDTAGRHLGIARLESEVVPVGEPLAARWVHLLADGADAEAREVEVSCVRVEHDWVLVRWGGSARWTTEEREVSVEKRRITSEEHDGALGRLDLTLPRPGTYRIRVRDIEDERVASLAVVAAARGDRWAPTSARRPDRVEVTLDRESYAPGDVAHVTLQSPFAGCALVSLESDRVLATRVVRLEGSQATVDLAVPETLRGGAFVGVTVVRPLQAGGERWVPHRAFGMARLATTHESRRLALQVDAPERALPGERIAVTVRAEGARAGALVQVLAVDEGILALSAFDRPDPFGRFFGARRLAVETTDTYADLLPDIAAPAGATRIGGDRGRAEALRTRTPVPARRREPAVIVSSFVPLGADGTVEVPLALPAVFTGALRVMVVAVAADAYGSAERRVTVASPVAVEMAWPRAVAPGDRFEVPVHLLNTTDERLEVRLEVDLDDGVEVADTGPMMLALAPGAKATRFLSATARAAGPVGVRVRAVRAGDAAPPRPDTRSDVTARDVESPRVSAAHPSSTKASEGVGESVGSFPSLGSSRGPGVPPMAFLCLGEARWELAVRAPALPHAKAVLWRVDAGEGLEIDPMAGLVPGTVRATLTASASPEADLLPAMQRLVAYPYGCVEQTTSRLRAMVRLPSLLVGAEGEGGDRAEAVRSLVLRGMDRLRSMQTASGGLGYWPGERTALPFGTAYAACFLAEARELGYPVDARLVRGVVRYLRDVLSEPDDGSLGLDPALRAHIVLALARHGVAEVAELERLTERVSSLDLEARAHVAAAWLALGRRDRAWQALPSDTLAVVGAPSTGSRITSPVRQLGALLGVLVDLDREHPWVARLVERLLEARKDGAWASTLEDATALEGLARYQLGAPRKQARFSGAVALGRGRTEAFDHADGLSLRLDERMTARGPIRLETEGEGAVYVALTAEGLSEEQSLRSFDRRLVVRRSWRRPDGAAIEPGTALRVGDLVHVEVTLVAPGCDRVDRIAIVDLLPGGLEAENARLATSAEAPEEGTAPDRVEVLDDRVVLFVSADRSVRSFRYALRATTAGRFVVPCVEASSMYDPSYASAHGAGEVVVKR